ncbi:MAG: thiamine pyrophosphate-binding protein [candidate division Zixibacteria bacterium]|nr:thiamine pyrophosphate-binding protein [candidate division Zixibacteria bacterium]
MTKKRFGAQIICATLEELGVSTLFCMAGTQSLPLLEALRTSGLRTIQATNELAASFMANGYFRASGKVGVLTTIPGPGFTYAISGLAEARMDSSALLYIAIKSLDDTTDKFQSQHLDQKAIAAHLAKSVIEITTIDTLRESLQTAYALSLSGEPGPVMVEIDAQLFSQSFPFSHLDTIEETFLSIDNDAVDGLTKALSASRKTIIFAGQGCANASLALLELAELLQAPVLMTSSGRGVISENHWLSLGYDCSSGATKTINRLLDECDLILALGCKFSHNGTGGFSLEIPPEKLVHIDASAKVLGAHYPASLYVQADIPTLLPKLLSKLNNFVIAPSGWTNSQIAACKAEIEDEQISTMKHAPLLFNITPNKTQDFFLALNRLLPDDAILVTDSGLHQNLARTFFSVRSARGLVIPSDFQSMGFGLPAALGAKLAAPHRQVVLVLGDGGLVMSAMELITAVRERISITVIVFNDSSLGIIRMQQIEQYGSEFATANDGCNFRQLAESMGVSYMKLEGKLESNLRSALANPGVTMLEVPLVDSPHLAGVGRKALAMQTIKNVLGPNILHRIKSALRR